MEWLFGRVRSWLENCSFWCSCSAERENLSGLTAHAGVVDHGARDHGESACPGSTGRESAEWSLFRGKSLFFPPCDVQISSFTGRWFNRPRCRNCPHPLTPPPASTLERSDLPLRTVADHPRPPPGELSRGPGDPACPRTTRISRFRVANLHPRDFCPDAPCHSAAVQRGALDPQEHRA